jgi:hypothetical protein
MKRVGVGPLVIGSIPEFCRMMELPPPEHPLVTVIRSEMIPELPVGMQTVVLNFFSVWLKTGADMGSMRFFLPGQAFEGALNDRGLWLLIQPELLWNFSVDKNIEQYGFFASAVSDVLRLAGKDEQIIMRLLRNIEDEYLPPVNACCQETILSHVEALFFYAEQCYRKRVPGGGAN